MGKRFWSLALTAALVAGVFTVLPAQAQSGAETKFFLSSLGCSAPDTNSDVLTVTDVDDEVECFYTAAGLRADIGEAVGTTPATSDRETATRRWDTVDGIPLVLDASRPVSGQIYTSGAECAATVAGVPLCSPVGGASAGEVIIEFALVGTLAGEEVELGTQTDSFESVPGDPHVTELEIQPDASYSGKTFSTIELRTWIHGSSVGHGVVKTTGEASSFVSVPTSAAAGPVVTDPPGTDDPPGKGKKKGCNKGKGKGKKKGACPGKKAPKKPKPPATAECPAYVPGDQGAEAETSIVTDAATEEAPVVVETEAEMGGPTSPFVDAFDFRSFVFQNVQVDSKNPDAGLYVKIEFTDGHDYDLGLFHPDGTEAASSGESQPEPGLGAGSPDGAWEGGSNYEFLKGIRTADCAGYTAQVAGYLTTGGPVTISMWLGEVVGDPAAAGGGETAMEMFYRVLGL